MGRTREYKPEKRSENCYRIKWTDALGIQRTENHRTEEEAKLAHRRHTLEAQEIKIGLRKPLITQKTFRDLSDYWLNVVATKKRSIKDDISIIKNHLNPLLGETLLNDITVFHSDKLHDLMRQNGKSPKTVHNVLTLLITLLNHAKALRWLDDVPRIKKPKIEYLELLSGNYLKTDDERRRFLLAASEESDLVYTFMAAAIYTGLRFGELAGLNKADIDLANQILTINRSYNSFTKGGKPRRIPIFDPLKSILAKWVLQNKNEILFPNQKGERYRPDSRLSREVFHRILDRAGFERPQSGWRKHYITFHGLRHTFATWHALYVKDVQELQVILGHQSITTTMVYAHFSPEKFLASRSKLPDLSVNVGSVTPFIHSK